MEDIKILGKVTDAKILKATKDRRSGRYIGLNGLVIEFETDEKITNSTVVYLVYQNRFKPFNVREVEIKDNKLIGRCEEVGYWAQKLGKDENLDLRTLIGCDVELIEDEKQLADIRESSCWC